MTVQQYLDAGHRIFPIWPITSAGICACGNPKCDQAGKHPRISRWQQVPHWSDEQIEVMLEHQRLADHFGVLCSGLLVVDIDPRNGGNDSYWRMVDALGGEDLALSSGFVVQTGSGGRHIYFAMPDPAPACIQHHSNYPGIDFKTSGFVVGAGSLHASGNRYDAGGQSPSDIGPPPQALLDLIARPDAHRVEHKGESVDLSDSDLQAMLGWVDNNLHYEDWIRVGMALHHATGGEGFHLWRDWSMRSPKFDPERADMDKKWHSFGKSASPVTVGTLYHFAEQGGYQRPVTFATDDQDDNKEPVPTGHIDLMRPPGLVGELTDWINSQCRYPRERLAVAAALTSLGNVAGLRCTDDKDGVTLNLITLCVAASATGKEAVLQAATAIHEAAALQSALMGTIKSEQEIVRNLVRNQAAYYVIDEIGYLLQKIESARKSGSAAYLEGVISMIMGAYSKADGLMPIGGDLKKEVRNNLTTELKQCEQKIKDNEDPHGHYAQRQRDIEEKELPGIDKGLERPFLSMMGITTPISFDQVMTVEQATNGFVGRSLLIREPETNPRRKRGFRKPARQVPEHLQMQLAQLYSGGSYDMTASSRVEYRGERAAIATEEAALDMLEDVADWLEDYAESHKGKTGLEAVVRRSYEQVAKVSTILAVGSGLRTTEHVEWAFAFCRADLETKIALAHANIEEGTDDALRVRTLEAVGDGEKRGTVRNRVSRAKAYSAKDADRMVEHLLSTGELQEEVRTHGGTGKSYSVLAKA